MSYLGGFSRLHSGDGGTQGMAKGEENVGIRKGRARPQLLLRTVLLGLTFPESICGSDRLGNPGKTHFGRSFPSSLMSESRLCLHDLVVWYVRMRIKVK